MQHNLEHGLKYLPTLIFTIRIHTANMIKTISATEIKQMIIGDITDFDTKNSLPIPRCQTLH